MDFIENVISKAVSVVWGPITIILLLGAGIYLSLGTRFVQFRKIKDAIKSLFTKDSDGEGDMTPFQALMTSLAATIGIGNIVGVASAISMGGPGAVFWMWVSGAFGGATKFSEVLLAVKFRITNENGEKSGVLCTI
jgi:Na+/alanine symporter